MVRISDTQSFLYKKTHLLASASETSVRINGLEPLRLSPLDPKSSAATNYAISAWCSTTSNKSSELIEIAKIRIIFELGIKKHELRTMWVFFSVPL